jgi:hypothetical protein
MGVLRVSSRGANSESSESCCRRSGEALRSNQVDSAGEIAIWAWVRAWPFRTPRLMRSQFEHLQFHWGKPPPAAEPRTLIRIYRLELSVRVGANFAVQFDYFVLRRDPFHECRSVKADSAFHTASSSKHKEYSPEKAVQQYLFNSSISSHMDCCLSTKGFGLRNGLLPGHNAR